ncbi:MAG: hypothetical protein ACAH95_17825, partial [Fimbriimonas sp.]
SSGRPHLMLLLALSLFAPLADDPQPLMLETLDRYAKLDSFSSTLVHQDSSGLFPGSFTQELKWKKGGRFELIVTKPNKKKLEPGSQGGYAPDFYSDGEQVHSFWKGNAQASTPIKPPENTSPGWEVSGGPILSFLVDSGVSKFYKNPPPHITLTFTWGPRVKWQGEEVREVKMAMTQGDVTLPIYMFLTKDAKEFVGYEWETGKAKLGWMHYTNRKENPVLPLTLGTRPKA